MKENNTASNGGLEVVIMSETEARKYVNVDEEYYNKLQEIAEDIEWRKGYQQGIDDGINYAIRIIQAMKEEV